jgi:hypothetical protein
MFLTTLSNTDDFCFIRFAPVKIADLPSRSVIGLRPIQEGNQKIGIIDMGFAAGENLFFGFVAEPVYLVLIYEIIREDDFDLRALVPRKGFDPFDGRTYPVPVGF